jgi:tryptophan synthase beta chain
VIREAAQANEAGDNRTILFNLCGHGHFDLSAYEDFVQGKLKDHVLDESALKKSIASVAVI